MIWGNEVFRACREKVGGGRINVRGKSGTTVLPVPPGSGKRFECCVGEKKKVSAEKQLRSWFKTGGGGGEQRGKGKTPKGEKKTRKRVRRFLVGQSECQKKLEQIRRQGLLWFGRVGRKRPKNGAIVPVGKRNLLGSQKRGKPIKYQTKGMEKGKGKFTLVTAWAAYQDHSDRKRGYRKGTPKGKGHQGEGRARRLVRRSGPSVLAQL